ncbi:MAG: tRNA lysidine(34) synthetase TilS [Acidimicrobiia bacterium]|nr:tRNA lysidine(34) synthetase TilS [Acidimicrobiia bacterium]
MAAEGGLTAEGEAILGAVRFPEAPLLVALGGGADSAVCAWAAVQSGHRVRAVTVNHGLPASPALIAASRAVAARLGIPHRLLAPVGGGTSEAALRVARYAALEAEADLAEVIVTGHTQDDQAETVLGNLLRGAGAGGLAGIPPRRGRWCRPLLAFSREQVRQAADALSLPYADDPGNEDLDRRRNLLRHEVLPWLEARLGPGVRPALARAAALLGADDAELERRAEAVPVQSRAGVIRLPAAALATLPPAIAGRVARRALRLLLDPYPGHGADVAAVLAAARGGPGAARPLEGGHRARHEGPWVVLGPVADAPLPVAVALPVPGEVDFGPWQLGAGPPGPLPAPLPVGRRWGLLDPAAVEPGLVVRAALPGDRVSTGEGHKPVAEALREAGVAAAQRRGWPVVASGGTIAWVPGARVAAWAAPRGPVAVCLKLREAG